MGPHADLVPYGTPLLPAYAAHPLSQAVPSLRHQRRRGSSALGGGKTPPQGGALLASGLNRTENDLDRVLLCGAVSAGLGGCLSPLPGRGHRG